MKHIIYITAFLIPMAFMAQEKPKNVSEETTTRTITVDDGKEVVEKKVKVTTREEQKIELAESDKNKVNQAIVDSPAKVTQTVQIDDDMDPFYDSETQSIHYSFNDEKYLFKRNNEGFLVSEIGSTTKDNYGHVMNTSRSNNYVFKSTDYNGIGYFDSNNNFIVEYYDADSNTIVKKVFTLSK
ncbi:hypothetical protein [Xanthomarina sp. F2636L]|uniref:hypothetical protein n=1 Tax=Xanthomarina sp. F2636L TaxID=2996018 RepID=UPI00225E1ABD|nr:hypothetical protein [Xanthomarina sp. F2636L]MCX7549548.1 hypothetical protein [Xanthomarina sp. F2636L]